MEQVDAAPSKTARIVTAVLAALCLLVGVTLVVVSLASYAALKHRLDSFASDDNANFSRSRFHAAVLGARLLAAILLGSGAATILRRHRVARLFDAVSGSAARDAVALARRVQSAVSRESHLHLGALIGICVVGGLVRLDFLFQPMRYDESGTYVHYASRPLYIGLSTYTAPNNQLLNTAFVHFTTAAFGNHPWAIRLPAFVAGVLLVPATYLTARVVFDRLSALLAACLVATSSTLVEYSTNARGYTTIALIFVLLLALATYLCESDSLGAWAVFAVLSALGFFTIPTMLYGFAAVVVWLCVSIPSELRRRLLLGRLLPAVVATLVLTLLLYTPVIVASGVHSLVDNQFVAPRSWSYFTAHLPSSLRATFARWHRDWPPPIELLFVFGFVLGLVFHRRISPLRVPQALPALLVTPILLALQRVVPFERVWLFLIPLYLMTAVAGLMLLLRRFEPRTNFAAAIAVVAVALAASLAGEAVASRAVARSEDTSTFRDAPKVAMFLKGYLRPGDRVLVSPPADLILEYYLDSEGLNAGRLLYTSFKAERLVAVVKEGPDQYNLNQVIQQHLGPGTAREFTPLLLRRYPSSVVYRLVRRD